MPTNPNFTDPRAALGAPDYSGGSSGLGAVSLGSGGLLELCFAAAPIANSGDSSFDLRIVEVGGYSEAFYIELRPAPPTTAEQLIDLGLQDADQDGFFEMGRVDGGETADVDLDAAFGHPVPEFGVRFDALQIVDDPVDHPTCTSTPGADIDAVVALRPYVGIAPSTWGRVKSVYNE